MTPQERTQAARNASQELRELVGTPWILGAVSLDAGGLDCIGLMVEAYTVIGRHLGEPELWRFPIPLSYPYPAELPDGSWMPEEDIAEWSRHFKPGLEPAFGVAATMLEDHIGVIIEPAIAGGDYGLLHAHRSCNTVLHPLGRIRRWVTGFYTLRPPLIAAEITSA